MADPVGLVAGQLRIALPDADWQSGGVDRAAELASLFVNSGILDLTKLGIVRLDDYEAVERLGRFTRADFEKFNAEAVAKTVRVGLRDPITRTVFEPAGTWRDCKFNAEDRGRFTVTGPSSLCDFVDRNNPGPVEPRRVLGNRLPLVFTYEGRQIGFLGDANNDGSISNAKPLFEIHSAGPMVAWSARGDGGVSYVVVPIPSGFAVAPFWGSHSEAGYWRSTLAMGASVAITGFSLFAGGFNPASFLGEAVTGAEFAAAYPQLTNAIGQTAIATAATGGDVERAVASVAAGQLGAIAGNYAAGLTDSQFVGKIAASAVAAQLAGGDPEQAAKAAALNFGITEGIKQMEIEFSTPVETDFDYEFGGDDYPDLGLGDMFAPAPTVPQFDASELSYFGSDLPTLPGSVFTGLPSATSFGDIFESTQAPPALNVPPFNPQPAPIGGGSGATGWDFAIAALKMLPQFINRQVPAPVAAPRASVTPAGGVDPRRLTPGVPVAGPDGRVYVNNGNGTYSQVDSMGRTATLPMPAGSVGGMAGGAAGLLTNPAVLVGIAGVAFLLLRRR